jgi:hypothetical protein
VTRKPYSVFESWHIRAAFDRFWPLHRLVCIVEPGTLASTSIRSKISILVIREILHNICYSAVFARRPISRLVGPNRDSRIGRRRELQGEGVLSRVIVRCLKWRASWRRNYGNSEARDFESGRKLSPNARGQSSSSSLPPHIFLLSIPSATRASLLNSLPSPNPSSSDAPNVDGQRSGARLVMSNVGG